MSSAHGLLSSVFSCSLSPKSISKRRLRQTRSLDSALTRHCGTDEAAAAAETSYQGDLYSLVGVESRGMTGEPLLERFTRFTGDFTWSSLSGRSVGLKPLPLQSLSELERVRLQDVALRRLLRGQDLGCHITIPKYGHKRKKSLRRKLDSLSKERSKDKEAAPQAFGIPLPHVISNDRLHKLRHEHPREEHSDPSELMLSFLHLTAGLKRANKELSSSNSSLSSTSETPNESPQPATPDADPRTRRRGGVSVDCITDLDDNQSRLLEALQLSLPEEAAGNRKKHRDKKLSLNPIYRQVPRVVDLCCQHLEKNGLQTVGIFRVGSSKKRVRQLREEFDQGWDVGMDEEHGVHDVAALLKEFLRDMPDPLLTRDLYTAFVNTILLDNSDQESALQLLIYLLPPCNSDTLQRLLCLLSTVSAHAEDSLDSDGQQIAGNRMTSLNLATIFGPNLLHKQKNSDKEFAVESFARAEESTAVIGVVQRLIDTYETLFMVPADLQNEVLVSLLETDPDVVDYLLRRKASQGSDSGLVGPQESFSLPERCPSSDSLKPSSGEVSPYDNNSPVLPSRLLRRYAEEGDGGQTKDRSGSTSPSLSIDKEASADGFWDTWQELFRKDFTGRHVAGSLGDASECDSCGSSEGLSGQQGGNKPAAGTTTPASDGRPHPPVTRSSSSGPHDQRERRGPGGSDDSARRTGCPACPLLKVRTEGSRSTPSLLAQTPAGPRQTADRTRPSGPGQQEGPDGPSWQAERWHVWQMLSQENPEALTETLV